MRESGYCAEFHERRIQTTSQPRILRAVNLSCSKRKRLVDDQDKSVDVALMPEGHSIHSRRDSEVDGANRMELVNDETYVCSAY